jgi:hypothetical protein
MVTDRYRIVNSRLPELEVELARDPDQRTNVRPAPPPDLLAPLIDEVALPVSVERLQAAVAQHARTHDTLMKLRQIKLQYSPSYIEPLTALRWVENGGHGGG